MAVAKRDYHGEIGSMGHITTVFSIDASTMHSDNVAAQVQPYACTLDVDTRCPASTIEPFKDTLGIHLLYAYACVEDIHAEARPVAVDNHVYGSIIEGILDGVGQ